MFVSKPVPAGKVANLDGADKSDDLQNLAELPGAELLQAQDFGLLGNPDAASAGLSAKPGVMQAPGTSARSESMSGGGTLHPTARTSAPMSNPFPAPSSSVRTNPSSIKR
jgi:hypothetical protein